MLSNQEILTKAIELAIAGGFDVKIDGDWVVYGNMHARLDGASPKDIIFNHGFAKALWGESDHTLKFPQGEIHMQSPIWQYHLQQMVVAEDPIKYLGDNLPG